MIRLLLSMLSRWWDAAEAARTAQAETTALRRELRDLKRTMEQSRIEWDRVRQAAESSFEQERKRGKELQEQLADATHELALRDAEIGVLKSEIEWAAALHERCRGVLDTETAILAATRAEALRRVGGETKG